MFASHRIAAGLFALTAIGLVTLGLAPSAMARVDCRPHDRACIALHGPSTAMERARTRALNREALESATPVMPPAPPPPRMGYRPNQSQIQYEREVRDWRQAQRRYDMEMRRRSGMVRRDERRGPGFRRPGRSRPQTAEQLDRDPCGPTGGKVDPRIAAPTPGLDGSTTGLTTFNARTNGDYEACRRRR